jgi:hypothetical protein
MIQFLTEMFRKGGSNPHNFSALNLCFLSGADAFRGKQNIRARSYFFIAYRTLTVTGIEEHGLLLIFMHMHAAFAARLH